jgi:hypothetical protein
MGCEVLDAYQLQSQVVCSVLEAPFCDCLTVERNSFTAQLRVVEKETNGKELGAEQRILQEEFVVAATVRTLINFASPSTAFATITAGEKIPNFALLPICRVLLAFLFLEAVRAVLWNACANAQNSATNTTRTKEFIALKQQSETEDAKGGETESTGGVERPVPQQEWQKFWAKRCPCPVPLFILGVTSSHLPGKSPSQNSDFRGFS